MILVLIRIDTGNSGIFTKPNLTRVKVKLEEDIPELILDNILWSMTNLYN